MKANWLFFLLLCLCVRAPGQVVNIRLQDGENIQARLLLPPGTEPVKEVVLYIHGTGPGTYLDHRKIGLREINYFDPFAKEFNARGIGFMSYSKRGVELGTEPPMYDKVDRAKFGRAVPETEVRDIGSMVSFLRKQKRLAGAKVILLGWSEGTVLAAMAAEDPKNRIDALFLAGYVNENMYDVIAWQFSGASSMVSLAKYFDTDHDNSISKAEYESDSPTQASIRKSGFVDARFEQIDINKDGKIDAADFRQLSAPRYAALLNAIQRGDGDWVWTNYFRVSIPWLRSHFALEPNKTRLLRLKMPIFIFQGVDDANCSAEWVGDIKRRFEVNGKSNLTAFLFDGHDHDLNYISWIRTGSPPPGIAKMLEVSQTLSDKK